ncbi:MAG TPA: hypothetical protein PKC18_19225 [Lacipirellulaceae bacterium]|nr:hypothetical protein [Lacipirellulaceae bacterium]
MNQHIVLRIGVTLAAAAWTLPALAQTVYTWDGDVSDAWTVAANWQLSGGADPPGPPDSTIRVEISTSAGNTPRVDVGDAALAGEVRIGRGAGAGVLTIAGGTLTVSANRFRVGADGTDGNLGTLEMTGGTLSTAFSLVTGSNSRGQINMSGGLIEVTGSGQDFNMDETQPTAGSNLAMSGGAITIVDVFLVDQTATVNMSGGSIVSQGDLRIRRDAVVTVTGGLLETKDGLELGSGATPGGSLFVNGGIVRAAKLDAVPGPTGFAEVNGAGLLQFLNSLESIAAVQGYIGSGYITTSGPGLLVSIVDVSGVPYTQVSAIPEPATATLASLCGLMLVGAARRRKFA